MIALVNHLRTGHVSAARIEGIWSGGPVHCAVLIDGEWNTLPNDWHWSIWAHSPATYLLDVATPYGTVSGVFINTVPETDA